MQLSNAVAAGAGVGVIFNVKTLADYSGQMGGIVFKRKGTYATAGTSISSMEFYTAVVNVDTLALTIDEAQNITATGTFEAATLTDGTLTITGGNLTTSGTIHAGGDIDTDSNLTVDGQLAVNVAINAAYGIYGNFSGTAINRAAYNKIEYSGSSSDAIGMWCQTLGKGTDNDAQTIGGRFEATCQYFGSPYTVPTGETRNFWGGEFKAGDRTNQDYAAGGTGKYSFMGGRFLIVDALSDWTANPTVETFGVWIANAPTGYGTNHTYWSIYSQGGNNYLGGGLTVDTPTLVVDEVNHNVGIGLTTIDNNYKLIIRRAANVNLGIGLQSSELAIAAFNDALSANIPMRFYASEFNLLNGSVGINTDTPDTKLQVVGTAGFGDDAGNETLFSATGDLLFAGDATVWNDMQFQISDAKVTPASLLPSWEAFTANTSEYAFGVNKEVDTSANEIPHSWKEGTTGHAHMHITTKAVPAQEEKAQFTVTFAYADTDEVWVEAPLTAELTIPISTTALTNFYLDLGDITLTNYLIEAQMRCRVKRIPKSAGGTEYTGDIFITQIGIHFEEDMVGSKTELDK